MPAHDPEFHTEGRMIPWGPRSIDESRPLGRRPMTENAGFLKVADAMLAYGVV